ncbi:extracellular solute-binding protein [Aureimonas pseudogalii]|uniref:Multiple sugar transport system substrate-binding protein n=1 Tax=Aureimonas pseudogalii TaxID=1744844 RepID=A0A7W6H8E7_9HYPH|nr:extracellular solute-binding protein [Aureimonas pseudogalii]MBB4000506.1 multiple sugar transport system substrate-binding protein [Aureimonas pseudogalii]
MRNWLLSTTAVLAMSIGGAAQAQTTINLQRFFGACEAEYGTSTDVTAAVGECGIMTSLVNAFEKSNPDIDVEVVTVEWPGYDQLNAQLASNAAPDVVSMHYSVISDYQSRGLLDPIDEFLAKEGVTPDKFSDASRAGVTRDGQLFGLPFDNWTLLFHVNLNLMKQAGLVNADGTPVLPRSTDELLAQARQFKEKTGKPYLIQGLGTNVENYTRLFYTLLQQQNVSAFDGATKANLVTPEAKAVVELMKSLRDEGLTTDDIDYTAAVTAFPHGDGGIAVNGTWLIGDYVAESEKKGSPLESGYTVYPVPQLFPGRDASYVDGHGWVLPHKERTPEQAAAIGKLLKYLYENDFQWARTGHLPAAKAVFDMAEFKSLPYRDNIAKIATTGQPLPPEIRRQFAIQSIIGEEVGAAVKGYKSTDEALATAQTRVDEVLNDL